jgi:thioesterase domain-containing protein
MEFAKDHNFVELAARVTDRTIAAQPDGPYVIMCYCALGPMALEVARQLETRGRRVRTLVMLNAVAPYYVDRLSPKARRIRRAAQVREALENFRVLLAMRKRGEISTASFIDNYSFLRRIGASRLLQRARLIDTTPTYRDQELLLEFPGVMRRMLLEGPLLEGRIDCDVVVFRTPDMLKGPAFPPALGWSDWVKGRVKVFDIGGKHIEILRESTATQIGKYLAAWLADEDGAEEKGVTV